MKLGKYKHYKGNIYQVIGVAKHSETLEELVVYSGTDKDSVIHMWARPREMFLEKVKINGKLIPRFEYLEKELEVK